MKRIYLICLILFISSPWSFAQSIDRLFKEYKKVENVECVNVGGFLMSFVKPFCKEAAGVNSIQVIDLSSCTVDVKSEFTKKVKKLKDKDYETLVRHNEDGETTLVLIAIKKEEIRELIVITTGEDCTMVRIKGRIKQSDVDALINS